MSDHSNYDSSTGDGSVGLSVEELAAATDTPVTTIRMYQHRGLIPAPRREGRRAIYEQHHVERLTLIDHLQRRGHSLAAIADAIDTWAAGGTLAGFLDTDEVLPGLKPEPLRLPFAELAARFVGAPLTGEDLQRAQALGLMRLADDGQIEVPVPAYAEIGPAIAAAGVPTAVILDEYEHLADVVDTIAGRFADVFDEHFWKPFVDRGLPADDLPALTSTARQLTDLASSTVVQLLRARFADLVDDHLQQAQQRNPGEAL